MLVAAGSKRTRTAVVHFCFSGGSLPLSPDALFIIVSRNALLLCNGSNEHFVPSFQYLPLALALTGTRQHDLEARM